MGAQPHESETNLWVKDELAGYPLLFASLFPCGSRAFFAEGGARPLRQTRERAFRLRGSCSFFDVSPRGGALFGDSHQPRKSKDITDRVKFFFHLCGYAVHCL